MTKMHSWIDELPSDSPDRDLLVAGRAAQVPAGSRERTWQALALTLGTATATASLTSNAAAATAAAVKSSEVGTATAIAAKTTAGAGVAKVAAGAAQAVAMKGAIGVAGLTLGIKSVAVGFLVGASVLGTGFVTERVIQRRAAVPEIASASTASKPRNRAELPASAIPDLPDHGAPREGSSPPAVEPQQVPTGRAPVEDGTRDPVAAVPLHHVRQLSPAPEISAKFSESHDVMPNAPAAAASGPPAIVSPGVPRTSALAEQARELAQIQRQLDAGAIAEAIRRLEVSYTSDPGYGLAQERDAMYVAALIKAQRNAQAIDLAKRFLMRYPNSPHSEKMRHLINAE